MFNFFFDTADIKLLNEICSNLSSQGVNYSPFTEGITTNPNAMSKINKTTLKEWEQTLPHLCEFVSKIKNGQPGEVYIQAPISSMSSKEVIAFARHIHKFNDGWSKIGLKISPNLAHLEAAQVVQHYMPVNVTGVADCATALSCCLYGVKYVSIIPGRMEEVGINADAHLKYLNRRNFKTSIITGSMRTIDGLKRAVEANTVPTIGTAVWDKIIKNEVDISSFSSDFNNIFRDMPMLAPEINNKNTSLSTSFFEQMDSLGAEVYKNFKDL